MIICKMFELRNRELNGENDPLTKVKVVHDISHENIIKLYKFVVIITTKERSRPVCSVHIFLYKDKLGKVKKMGIEKMV